MRPLYHGQRHYFRPCHRSALLKSLMDSYDFQNLDVEWWHYTLRSELYPNTYFNFPVR